MSCGDADADADDDVDATAAAAAADDGGIVMNDCNDDGNNDDNP